MKGLDAILESIGIPGWVGDVVLGGISVGSLVWGYYKKWQLDLEKQRNHRLGIDHNRMVIGAGPVIAGNTFGRRTAREVPNIGAFFTVAQIELLKVSVIADGPMKGIIHIKDADQRRIIFATLVNMQNDANNPRYSGLMAGVHSGEAVFSCFITLESHEDTPAGVLEKFRLEMITRDKARVLIGSAPGTMQPIEPKLKKNLGLHTAAAREMLSGSPLAQEIFWEISLPVA